MNNEFVGKNSISNLEKIIKNYNFKKILIYKGLNSYVLSGMDHYIKSLPTNLNLNFFVKKQNLPEYDELNLSIKYIKNIKPDLIIAVGGGAVLDLAKISNCLASEKNIKKNIVNSRLNIKKRFCPLIAIPTTAGSGAEVTSNAVIYINNKKFSVENKKIKPNFALVDPSLILNAPKYVSASSGLDAVAQAIESMMSIKSNEQSYKYAKKSLSLSAEALENYIQKKNFSDAYKMSKASYLAGKAINISKTTAPHAVSYPFTSYYNVSHGHAVGFTICDFLKFNYENLKYSKVNFNLNNRYKYIFKIFKVSNINELNKRINNLMKNIGLNKNLRNFNFNSNNDINLVLREVNLQRLSNNPVEITRETIKNILIKKIK